MTTSTCQRLFRRSLIVTVLTSIPLVASAGAPFEDVSKATGFVGKYTLAAWGNFDNDGWVDCCIGTELLRNNKGKKFVGLGRKSGVPTHKGAGIWGDYDNDGHLDLMVGNFSHRGQPPAQFLRNSGPDGDFKFQDRSGTIGLHWQESYANPTLADFDNDGFLDFYLVTVDGHNHSVLYRNVSADFSRAPDETADSPISEWVFKDVTKEAKTGLAGSSSMAAWADYDNEGDLDLAAGGQLFRNPGSDNPG